MAIKNKKKADTLYLMIEHAVTQQDILRKFFKISNDESNKKSIDEILEEEIPPKTTVYRFSKSDNCIFLPKESQKSSKVKRNSFFIETRKKTIIKKGIIDNTFYFTLQGKEYLNFDKDIRIAPINVLMDRYILEKFGNTNDLKIINIVFRGKTDTILITYVIDHFGNVDHKNFLLNYLDGVESEEEIYNMVIRGLENKSLSFDEDENYILIPEYQLLDYVDSSYKKEAYPSQFELFNIDRKIILSGFLSLGVLSIFCGIGFQQLKSMELNSLTQQEEMLKEEIPNIQAVRGEMAETHIKYYLSGKSVDFRDGFKTAESLQLPFAINELKIDEKSTTIDVRVRNNLIDNYYVVKMMNQQNTPEKYIKTAITSNSGLDNYGVRYVKIKK